MDGITTFLIDKLTVENVTHISINSLKEKGRRLPIHSVHRWWSRRFSALYRGILSSYLLGEEEVDLFYKSFYDPSLLKERAKDKLFFEPFCGGGTGLIEASLFGYNVIGVDVNPIATRATKASLLLVNKSIKSNTLKELAIKILDKALDQLKEFWTYDGKIISYVFVTKDKVPSWLTTYTANKKEHYILQCPHCKNIVVQNTFLPKYTTCPHCGYEFEITHKPKFKVSKKLPHAGRKWKIWALELRNPSEKWKKEVIPVEKNPEVHKWLENTSEQARELAKDIEMLLDTTNIEGLLEGKRLKREGVDHLSELYTWKQLLSFKIFSELAKDIPKKFKLLFSVALSESAKSSSLAAKWHSPIGEPVPAGAMKTYWIPEYTVETNPLAHVPGTLRPLARNSLASSFRAQIRALEYSYQMEKSVSNTQQVILGDSEIVSFPKNIDLAVVDPPYMDSVKSYASISLVHYGALKVFDHYGEFNDEQITKYDLTDIEKSEISRKPLEYKEKITKILSKLHENLNKYRGRVVFLYNRKNFEDWKLIMEAIRDSKYYPVAIYWTLGESPGSLARSSLKGLYAIVLTPTNTSQTQIVFNKVVKDLKRHYGVNIDRTIEKIAYKNMLKAIESVYSDLKIIER